MSTPVTTPVITIHEPAAAQPAKPRFWHRKLVRTIAGGVVTLAVSIGVGAMVQSHDTKKAMSDFSADVRDEPGIKSVREVPAPSGYEGKLEINGGAAVVSFQREGDNLMLSYELNSLDPDAATVDKAITHAADEAGFDKQP
jgi:hypothetical protein